MTDASARVADEAAIHDLFDELREGWNDGDGARFAAVFADDGDLIGFDGTRLRGRPLIERFHQTLFDKWMKDTRMTGTVEDVRFVGADTAVLHTTSQTIKRGRSKPSRARDSIQTMVAVRMPEGWRLAAFQNTRFHPMGTGFLAFVHWSIGDALWGLLRLSTDPTSSLGAGHGPSVRRSPMSADAWRM